MACAQIRIGRCIHVVGKLWRVVALLSLSATALAAQDSAYRAQISSDCQRAIPIIARGRLAPEENWAWTAIQLCGAEGGSALATALRNARASTDTAYLDQLAGRARWLRDASFFSAALDVAADRDASVIARLHSMIVVLYAKRLARERIDHVPVAYQDLLSPFDERSGLPHPTCGFNRTSTGEVKPYQGAPLPENYQAQIIRLAGHVFRDLTEPDDVRSATFCLL
jgi:hypothetical protein